MKNNVKNLLSNFEPSWNNLGSLLQGGAKGSDGGHRWPGGILKGSMMKKQGQVGFPAPACKNQ
jgi:hypothetical protein